uniref:Uncharacterized protein n=1 Tax=Aegilops tauschii subsp. strangulata TaxID=200361 RepID=A0A453EMS8_AEGTS
AAASRRRVPPGPRRGGGAGPVPGLGLEGSRRAGPRRRGGGRGDAPGRADVPGHGGRVHGVLRGPGTSATTLCGGTTCRARSAGPPTTTARPAPRPTPTPADAAPSPSAGA